MRKLVVSVLLLSLAAWAHGATAAATEDVLVKVNGTGIPKKYLEEAVKARVSQGGQDTPELRKLIKEELVARELLAQEAKKLKLDQTSEAREQKHFLEQNFMIELALADYMSKHPVTDAEMKAEYDRQLAEIQNGGTTEYRLAQIVVASEAEAKAAMARIKGGESFEKVASEVSIDPSKANGGELGWILPKQIIPQIGNVVVNVRKGDLAAEPIRTNLGWHVVKVEDTRAFKAPAFDDVKNQLRSAIIQKRRFDLLTLLKGQAKIN
jgi:peptidyl-prolyl cis-trans isomerase C